MSSEASPDPLRELLVDARDIDRRAIASTLRNRIAVDSMSGRLHLGDEFTSLKSKEKLLLLLLGQKVARLLEVSERETLSFGEIVEISGLPRGTAAPTLKDLKARRLVDQAVGKAYFVPDAQVTRAIRVLERQD